MRSILGWMGRARGRSCRSASACNIFADELRKRSVEIGWAWTAQTGAISQLTAVYGASPIAIYDYYADVAEKFAFARVRERDHGGVGIVCEEPVGVVAARKSRMLALLVSCTRPLINSLPVANTMPRCFSHFGRRSFSISSLMPAACVFRCAASDGLRLMLSVGPILLMSTFASAARVASRIFGRSSSVR